MKRAATKKRGNARNMVDEFIASLDEFCQRPPADLGLESCHDRISRITGPAMKLVRSNQDRADDIVVAYFKVIRLQTEAVGTHTHNQAQAAS
jgi:hypothetical protein